MNILPSIATGKLSVFVEKIRRIRTQKERGLHSDVCWPSGAEFSFDSERMPSTPLKVEASAATFKRLNVQR